MASLIEQVILTCSSIEQNSNKVWVGELYDNGDVITRWGRIRGDLSNDFSSLDFKEFPNAGESFLRKKERDKLRPKKDKECYTRVPTVRNNGAATVVQPAISNLQSVAREQLAKSNPVLTQLIDRLVKANVHNIVSQTSITYNSVTGLFMSSFFSCYSFYGGFGRKGPFGKAEDIPSRASWRYGYYEGDSV